MLLWLPLDKTVSCGKCYVVLLLVHRFRASRCQQCTLCSTNSTGSRRINHLKVLHLALRPANKHAEWTPDFLVTALLCDLLSKETVFHSHVIYQLVVPTLVRELEAVGKGRLSLNFVNSDNWESSASLFISQWACIVGWGGDFHCRSTPHSCHNPSSLGASYLNSFTRNMKLCDRFRDSQTASSKKLQDIHRLANPSTDDTGARTTCQ